MKARLLYHTCRVCFTGLCDWAWWVVFTIRKQNLWHQLWKVWWPKTQFLPRKFCCSIILGFYRGTAHKSLIGKKRVQQELPLTSPETGPKVRCSLSILYLLRHTKLPLSFGKLDKRIEVGRVWNWESVVKLVWIVALLFCDSSCTPSDWRYTPTGTVCAGYTSGATWAARYATGACMTNIRNTEFAGAS